MHTSNCLTETLAGYASMRNAVLACMSAVLAFRVGSLVYYLPVFPKEEPRDPSKPSRWKKARQASTAELAQGRETEDATKTAVQVYEAIAASQFEASILLGTIAAATWSVLFVASKEGEPASRLSGVSLGLLFIGAVILIAGPLLARGEETHLGLLFRDAAVYLGFNAILFSFCSMAMDLAPMGWRIVALIIVVGATVRDVMYTLVHYQRTSDLRKILRGDLPPEPAAEPESPADGQQPAAADPQPPAPEQQPEAEPQHPAGEQQHQAAGPPTTMLLAFTLLGFVAGRWLPRRRSDRHN